MRKPEGSTKIMTANCSFNWKYALPQSVVGELGLIVPSSEQPGAESLASLILSPPALQKPNVQRYVGFLKTMFEICTSVAELYDLLSPSNSQGTKIAYRQINVPEMMYIANHLYILDSFGVPGGVLECGCFQGFSTCCLSHACRYIGRPLWVADSFQGLPCDSGMGGVFHKGDYSATYDQVISNVRSFGCLDGITFIKGWFSESLRNWRHPLALLWIDADLYESTRDVMACVLPTLEQRSVIFMHDFTDGSGVPYDRASRTVPGAVFEAIGTANKYAWVYSLEKYFGVMVFSSTPQPCAFIFLKALLQRLAEMDPRYRAYRSLRDSRTVRMAFTLKRWLSPSHNRE